MFPRRQTLSTIQPSPDCVTKERSSRLPSLARQKLLQRDVGEALQAFLLAEQAGADARACAAGRWECHMLLGDFEAAWKQSDAIEQRGYDDKNRLWDGSDFSEQRTIVRCLHGYGDAIQFIRYIPMLNRQAASVIVETHPEMVSLLRRADGVDEVISWGATSPHPEPPWDRQIEIMELPRAFRTSLASIPARVPYIHVSERERAEFRRRLAGYKSQRDGMKVGLVWRSSGWNPLRSMQLSDMLPLCSTPGYSFYSLQWDATYEEAFALRQHDNLENLAGNWRTLEEFAIVISSMDLIITVDTMAAHLAGALAAPVWVLLPCSADWRWMIQRADSPWYPTMRLFRQTNDKDWSHCIRTVKGQLLQMNGTAADV